jgi:hypothetical protein
MNHLSSSKPTHPILFVIKNFIGKLTQQPWIYPIKYYKKGMRVRRNTNMISGI